MSRVWGTTSRRTMAWLFGEAPTERFLDPLLADIQGELARAGDADLGARARLRVAACIDVLRVMPAIAVRAEPSSAVRWALAPALALSTGLVALSASGQHLRLQAVWAVVAVAAMLALRLAGRRLLSMGALPVCIVAASALLPSLVSGERWMRTPIGAIVVTPLELARPVLLLALGALLATKPHRARAGAVVVLAALAIAAAVRTQDPVGVVVASLMCAAALSAFAGRGARLVAASSVLLGIGGVVASLPPWDLAWLDAGALRAAVAGGTPPVSDLGTDYVLAALGARTGWIGVALAVLAVGLVAWTPLRAAGSGPARAMARALATWIGVELVSHVATVLGLLPAFGAPLPVVSYGGSSLVALFAGFGLVAACVDARPGIAAAGSRLGPT